MVSRLFSYIDYVKWGCFLPKNLSLTQPSTIITGSEMKGHWEYERILGSTFGMKKMLHIFQIVFFAKIVAQLPESTNKWFTYSGSTKTCPSFSLILTKTYSSRFGRGTTFKEKPHVIKQISHTQPKSKLNISLNQPSKVLYTLFSLYVQVEGCRNILKLRCRQRLCFIKIFFKKQKVYNFIICMILEENYFLHYIHHSLMIHRNEKITFLTKSLTSFFKIRFSNTYRVFMR